jgi:hypothetical protein
MIKTHNLDSLLIQEFCTNISHLTDNLLKFNLVINKWNRDNNVYDQTESIIYIHTVVNKSSTHSHEDELRSEIQNNCLGKYTKGRKLHQHLSAIHSFIHIGNSNILIIHIHLFQVPIIFMQQATSPSPSAHQQKKHT